MPPVAKIPDWLEPMAATLTQDRFIGHDWLFERKFDGIRLLAYKCGSDVQLYSRNRLPQHLPAMATAIASLPVDEVILDGEVTWDGRSAYHVFDILWLNGRAVTALPLEDRRAVLQELPLEDPMRLVEVIHDPAPWERARREGWEGVIAKRRGSPYEHRRSKHWLKMKCETSQEFVVGGFTDPQGSRVDLGALLVGYYEEDASSMPVNSAPASTRSCCWICAVASTRSSSPNRRLRPPRDCPDCARTGCVQKLSFRSRSSNGPCTASCGTRGWSVSASTRTRATSHGSRGDYRSRESASLTALSSVSSGSFARIRLLSAVEEHFLPVGHHNLLQSQNVRTVCEAIPDRGDRVTHLEGSPVPTVPCHTSRTGAADVPLLGLAAGVLDVKVDHHVRIGPGVPRHYPFHGDLPRHIDGP